MTSNFQLLPNIFWEEKSTPVNVNFICFLDELDVPDQFLSQNVLGTSSALIKTLLEVKRIHMPIFIKIRFIRLGEL